MSDPIVTLEDARALRYCASGMRDFFAHNGLDWNEFRTRGLPASVIEATGDGMAARVAQRARERSEGTAK